MHPDPSAARVSPRVSTVDRTDVLLVLPAAVVTLGVVLAGLVPAFLDSLGVGGPDAPSVDASQVLDARALTDGLRVTLGVATASTVLALIVGYAGAALVLRTRAGGRLVAALAAAVVPVPHLVGAAATALLLSDSGLLARLSGAGPGEFPPLVAGPWWVAVVAEYAWKESAFVLVVVLSATAATARDLDEAGAVLGAGAWRRLRGIGLPLAAPALVVAGTVVFAYVAGSYEVAWLLGRTYPEPLPVMAYRLWTDVDLAARAQGLAVALGTVAVCAIALLVGTVLLRRVSSPTGQAGPA